MIKLLIILTSLAIIFSAFSATPKPTPAPKKKLNTKLLKKRFQDKTNKIFSAIAQTGMAGDSLACCKGIQYHKCAELRPKCFPTKIRNELVCQDEITRFCKANLQKAGGKLFKKGITETEKKNEIGGALLDCLQQNEKKFSKPCVDSLKNRITAIAKSKNTSGNKGTNLSRDEVTK